VSLEPQGRVKLTGRGAVVALFVFCFLILPIAAWTGWDTLAGAAFVCGCGLVTCYTKSSGLRTVVVCPPLLFLAGAVCAQALTAAGGFMAAEGVLVMLGTAAPWLFTGTALTVVIAAGRGYRPTLPGMAAVRNLVEAGRRLFLAGPASRVSGGQLALHGGRVGADPFLGDQAVGDPVELVADVGDGPARGGQAQVIPQVGAAERQPEGHLVAGRDDIVDLRVQVGEGAPEQIGPVPPHVRTGHRGQAGQVHHEIRAEAGDAGIEVARVERVEGAAYERDVGGGGDLL
jgi:hypothetical protein